MPSHRTPNEIHTFGMEIYLFTNCFHIKVQIVNSMFCALTQLKDDTFFEQSVWNMSIDVLKLILYAHTHRVSSNFFNQSPTYYNTFSNSEMVLRVGDVIFKKFLEMFDYRHSPCRHVIERAFGVWIQKWKILDCIPNYSLRAQTIVVETTMGIDNFIRWVNLWCSK